MKNILKKSYFGKATGNAIVKRKKILGRFVWDFAQMWMLHVSE